MSSNKIKVLPDKVVHQIAAGEIVERPVSVVKELVDNSLDAGASEILIYLEGGGKRLVRVVDNGCGMSRDDALMAFENHATSKIQGIEDLNKIATMGFRGEALPSIASVSKVLLRTRVEEDDSATEVVVEGGKVVSVRGAAGRRGTDISVRALFYNLPARRKFLKQDRTEEIKIKQWVTYTAAVKNGVRFVLTSEGRELINFPAVTSPMDRIRQVVKGDFVEINSEREGMKIIGAVCHPGAAKTSGSSLVFLVNGRVIRDGLLFKAVKDGFMSTLKRGETPVGLLALDLHPRLVDVNVHPQKSEVRFADQRSIYLFVRYAVERGVNSFRFAVTPQKWGEKGNAYDYVRKTQNVAPGASSSISGFGQREMFKGSGGGDLHSEYAQGEKDFRFSDLRYIGQALGCYLLCELGDSLYVVDMHAAHERYNYNLIRNRYKAGSLPVQSLLVPIAVELEEELLELCHKNAAFFESYGFEIELFGESTLLVRSAPPMVSQGLLKELISELAKLSEEVPADGAFSAVLDKVAAAIACKSSVRSGDSLSREEVYSLFRDLDSTEFSAACPHGRPVVVRFERSEVE
ncbi:MAG: DNA mismatch repair endonuclease MutL, partial [Candidatus Dadabacteria bacterium]